MHVAWLSLIRYQARLADEQSRTQLPLATLSINWLPDAVESMLHGSRLVVHSPLDTAGEWSPSVIFY
ncbi:MAG: hypothetical protein ACRDSF_09690 [Pseudonocardiaceae bacterium]